MYCSLDRLDMIVRGKAGEVFGAQVDHRGADEIEATPELSVLFALARVINAREHLRERGEPAAGVRYMLESAGPVPERLRTALDAAGAILDVAGVAEDTARGSADAARVGALADDAFRALAARASTRIGSRDPAMALRMLEDQTLAAPIARADDEPGYWTRVLELAALVGELMRARIGGRWVETAHAVVPFAFQLAGPQIGVAEMFPTNRAQRFLEDGGESLLKLVAAAEETMRKPPDAATDRLMPSLRTRASVALDEVAWRPLLGEGAPADVPIIVCGVDGEITFGMVQRASLGARSVDDALDAALDNLADEPAEREVLILGELRVVVVTGGFYAAEKLLDRAFMVTLQDELAAPALAAAVPARGELLVCADAEHPTRLARFCAFVSHRFDDAGSRQISSRVLRVEDGVVVGCATEPEPEAEHDVLRAETEPAAPRGVLAPTVRAQVTRPRLDRARARVTCTCTCTLLLICCHSSDPGAPGVPEQPPPAAPRDAGPPPPDASPPWTDALATYPHVEPLHVITLPTRAQEPRFDVGGPVISGSIAIVSSSQFGFIGVDWRAGTIAWTKPTGSRVAPPLARAGGAVLIGECVTPPQVPDDDVLLGCLRAVTTAGTDQGYVAIHGKAAPLAPFAASAGPQRVWETSDRSVTWRRGDVAISVDTLTGVATPTRDTADPAIPVHYKDKTWDITRAADGTIHARQRGKDAWHTERPYGALLGAVYLPEQAPMVRAVNLGAYGGHPELTVFDIDATGSLHGQVAFPVPALGLLGHAVSSVGDAAIAIRLDRSLRHDYLVGYAASALLMYVYPLPDVPRADPVGVAVAPEAVVVFHDGDTVTVLPELSAPPTAPGAARAPSETRHRKSARSPRASRERAGTPAALGICMMIKSLVAASVLSASFATGCVIQKDAPNDIAASIPTSDQVQIKLPASADRMLGELAPYYVVTRDVTSTFNGGTAWVLVLIHSIVLNPPTSVAGNVYTWGPGSQALDPANYRLDVTANTDGTYDYVLSGQSKINPTGFKSIIDGHADPTTGGVGKFRIDFDAAAVVNPVDNGNAKGQVQVGYDIPAGHLELDISSTDASGAPVAATYEYDQAADGGGDMTFDTDANVGGTAALEDLTMRSRWLATGAGRADVRLSGGDLGSDQAIASECWDASFGRVYYTDNVNFEPTEGAVASCAFADQDLPPAE